MAFITICLHLLIQCDTKFEEAHKNLFNYCKYGVNLPNIEFVSLQCGYALSEQQNMAHHQMTHFLKVTSSAHFGSRISFANISFSHVHMLKRALCCMNNVLPLG